MVIELHLPGGQVYNLIFTTPVYIGPTYTILIKYVKSFWVFAYLILSNKLLNIRGRLPVHAVVKQNKWSIIFKQAITINLTSTYEPTRIGRGVRTLR
jgi:hypothetical protein